MKHLLFAITALCFLPTASWAQCNGVFQPNTVCGNFSASPAPPSEQTAAGTLIIGPSTSVVGDAAVWNNLTGTLLKDVPFLQVYGTQSANTIFAGPSSGSAAFPTWRAIVAADLPAGVLANVLNTQTLPYTIATSDCGKTVNIANGPGTLTLPAVAGFAGTCAVKICNTAANDNSHHAVTLSGFPAGNFPHLWMGQCIDQYIINGVWQLANAPGKFIPAFTPTCYVDTGGSNTNDGLVSNASTSAVKDPQQCIATWIAEFDMGSAQPTIALTNGQTNTQNGGAGSLTLIGGSPKVVFVQGNGGNATLQTANSTTVTQTQDFGGYFIFSNITLDCTSASAHPCYGYFGHQQGGIDINASVIFKGADAGDYGAWCDSFCKINGNNIFTISGTLNFGVNVNQGSAVSISNGFTTAAGTTIANDLFQVNGASSLIYSGPMTAVAATSVAEIFGARSGSTICASQGTVTGTFTGARQWSILGNSVFSNLSSTAVPGTAGITTASGFAAGAVGAGTSGGC